MSWNWNRNKLTGDIAEKTVEFLINSMPNWKCNKFGLEDHTKDIQNMVRKVMNPIATMLRKMPDFVAFNEKTEEIFFIEVKFRSKNYFSHLENYNEYWKGTKLILVHKNKPHFTWVDLEKINISTMRKGLEKIGGEERFRWDFGEIQKDIKTLFPDLKDENIEEARKNIIGKDED